MIRNIKNLNNEEIYNNLLPVISNSILKYDYIKIDNDLIMKVIELSKNEYKDTTYSFDKYFKIKLEKTIKEEIRKQLNDEKESFNIISNYINKKSVLPLTYENSMNSLKGLNKFLLQCSFDANIELLIDLINKNNNFNNMIKIIVDNNYQKIINIELDKVFNNDFISQLVLTYCMINDIEIYSNKSNEEIISDDENIDKLDIEGQYLKEIGSYPLLSKEDEVSLFTKLRNGDTNVFNYIVNCNLRLVVSVAKRFSHRGLEFLDLIQEGSIGLMIAVKRFDYIKGYKFSTYAINWIECTIRRALAFKSRAIRIPVYNHDALLKIKKIRDFLINKLEREPTAEEIAKEINLPIERVKYLLKIQPPVSLNSIVGDDKDDSELGDFISTDDDTLESICINNILIKEVQELIENCNLNEQEREVIVSRFGLFNNERLTLEEIGRKYNVTRECIRQIENKVIYKFIRNQSTDKLADYMDNPKKARETLKQKREEYYSGIKKEQNETQEQNKNIDKRSNYMEKRTNKTKYDYFKGYSKEEVDKVIDSLLPEEKYVIELKEKGPLDRICHFFFMNTIKKITRRLENPNSKTFVRKNPGEGFLKIREMMQAEGKYNPNEIVKEEKIIKKTQEKAKKEKQTINEDKKEEQKDDHIIKTYEEKLIKNKEQENLTKEDYLSILKVLRACSFKDMLEVMPIKDAIIVALRFGYVDGKCFETKKIAEFLEISEEEVRNTSKNVLLLYKSKFNDMIDNIIKYTDNEQNLQKEM